MTIRILLVIRSAGLQIRILPEAQKLRQTLKTLMHDNTMLKTTALTNAFRFLSNHWLENYGNCRAK